MLKLEMWKGVVSSCLMKLACICRSIRLLIICFCHCFYHYILLRMNSLSIELIYFVSVSFIGFWVLKGTKPRTQKPRSLDLFFTSVSAATASSMSTVEMEVFSDVQLMVLTILMLIGGEVFTSMAALHLGRWFKLKKYNSKDENKHKINNSSAPNSPRISPDSPSIMIPELQHGQMEMQGVVYPPSSNMERKFSWGSVVPAEMILMSSSSMSLESINSIFSDHDDFNLKYKSIKFLGYIALGYILVNHVVGVALISIYLRVSWSARNVLKKKGIKEWTFSAFTQVSTFSGCGFVPTNENMMVFVNNSGLLLILIPQVLLGNTLYPSFLRFSIWSVGKFVRSEEANYLLNNNGISFLHLLPQLHSRLLVLTVLGFIFVQLMLICAMEWNGSLAGLSSFHKLVGGLFVAVNTRHAGETVFDISTFAPAILVLFTVMMYLPPYTSFLPVKSGEEYKLSEKEIKKNKRRSKIWENIIFSQLSYLVIFIILVCITERDGMKEDPLNFSVLNIVIEVISAYGNVGFTTGYSCDRQLNADNSCESKWYGLSGKWSDQGKLILIVVMIFGRLKRFNMNGGKSWILL